MIPSLGITTYALGTTHNTNNELKCLLVPYAVLLTSSNTYSKPYDEVVNKSADVNGDRHFDLQDLAIITSEKNYGKEAITVSFGEIAE